MNKVLRSLKKFVAVFTATMMLCTGLQLTAFAEAAEGDAVANAFTRWVNMGVIGADAQPDTSITNEQLGGLVKTLMNYPVREMDMHQWYSALSNREVISADSNLITNPGAAATRKDAISTTAQYAPADKRSRHAQGRDGIVFSGARD